MLSKTLVTRLIFEGKRVTGVEIATEGKTRRVAANLEVVVSLGAIQTPRLLMQSGIGDAEQLKQFSIPLVQHLPGVGKNLQDHVNFGCTWESQEPIATDNNVSATTLYWRSDPSLEAPDLMHCQAAPPVPNPDTAHLGSTENGWTTFAGVVRPHSRGVVRPHSRGLVSLTGPDPTILYTFGPMRSQIQTMLRLRWRPWRYAGRSATRLLERHRQTRDHTGKTTARGLAEFSS